MYAERKVSIPPGVTVTEENSIIIVTGPKGSLQRDMWYPGIAVSIEPESVTISTPSSKKQTYAMIGTFASHIVNMCTGVTNGYIYTMKVVYSHFPVQIKVQGERLEIVNFLGEKHPRYAKILPETSVKAGNDEVVVTGINKELVGATAANIERATRIRNRDPRVFQDGIYIVKKE
ncbi:MAG: 50S ribosomal protein L6 [Methanospirillaceae archaeon]|nr:50S ribosomal protein L6 [Methanospirillaceae archaeon]